MYRISKLVVHTAAGLMLLVAGACSEQVVSGKGSNIKPVAERNAAPEFSLKDRDGRTVSLSDYKGQVVLLNFWATWCSPCAIEIPWFKQFENQHKDKGFAVLGVSMDMGGWEDVNPYLDRVKVNYRILLGDDDIAMSYGGVEALPTSFLIDREGRIAAVHVGLVSKSDYENDINALLSSQISGVDGGAGAVVARAD